MIENSDLQSHLSLIIWSGLSFLSREKSSRSNTFMPHKCKTVSHKGAGQHVYRSAGTCAAGWALHRGSSQLTRRCKRALISSSLFTVRKPPLQDEAMSTSPRSHNGFTTPPRHPRHPKRTIHTRCCETREKMNST